MANRNNQFTDKEKRGIELILKSLMKKYNFIYDWRLSPDWESWATHLYIDLYIDPNKLSEYFGIPVDPFYERNYFDEKKPYETSILLSILNIGEFKTPERQKYLDLGFNLKKDMNSFLENIYDHLPDDMIIKWKGETGAQFKCIPQIDLFIHIYK